MKNPRTAKKRKPEPSKAGRPRPAPAKAGGKKLGYADDAGHPGGRQDLSAKTEVEAEHDGGSRHG